MPLAISGGCFSFAVKLKLKAHILVWFVQNFEAWEKKNPSLYPHLFSICVCFFLFHLFVPVYVPYVSLRLTAL